MKSLIRKIAVVAFVLSLALIVPRVGKVLAQSAPDFTLGPGGRAQITYETSNCINDTYNPSNTISCEGFIQGSDSYEVNVPLDASSQTDLNEDITTHGLVVAFFNGVTCAEFASGVGTPNFISTQYIPGTAMHTTTTHNGKFTIYSFEGNVPGFPGFSGDVLIEFPFFGFDHLEMNLKVDHDHPEKSALHIQANADLCDFADASSSNNYVGTPLTGPVNMLFDIGGDGSDITEDSSSPDDYSDYGCVQLTPRYKTLDVSSAACFDF